MKRIVVIIAAVFLAITSLSAQDKSMQTLNFIYITHSPRTQTDRLIYHLREYYGRVLRVKMPTIFYLTNGRQPVIVQVNTPNDNRKDFGEIVYQLQSMRSHSVNPQTDVRRIMELFDEFGVVDDLGNVQYARVEWNYFVDSAFWQAGHNESVIARLYWVLDMYKMELQNRLKINIRYGTKDPLPIKEQNPYGAKNLCPTLKSIPVPYK